MKLLTTYLSLTALLIFSCSPDSSSDLDFDGCECNNFAIHDSWKPYIGYFENGNLVRYSHSSSTATRDSHLIMIDRYFDDDRAIRIDLDPDFELTLRRTCTATDKSSTVTSYSTFPDCSKIRFDNTGVEQTIFLYSARVIAFDETAIYIRQ